jgi:hypothetical protein
MKYPTLPPTPATGAARAVLCLALAASAQAFADTTSSLDVTWDFTRPTTASPNYITLPVEPNPAIADSFYRFAQTGGEAMVGWTQDRNGGNGGVLYTTGRNNDPLVTYIVRTLNDGSLLAKNQALTDFSVSITNWWLWGNGSHTSAETTLLGLFNADGNGYLAEVVRSGTVTLWSVTGGVTGTRIQIETATFAPTLFPAADNKQILLSLSGTTLTFGQKAADGTGEVIGEVSTSVAGTAYGNFITLVVGAGFGGNDRVHFDDLHLTGTVAVTAIPEPATLTFVMGGLALAVFAFARRVVRHS